MSEWQLNISAMEKRFQQVYSEIVAFEAALETTFPDEVERAKRRALAQDDRAILIERMRDDLIENGLQADDAQARVNQLMAEA